MKKVYFTINLKTQQVVGYGTREEATTGALKANGDDPDHPAFRLYGVSPPNSVVYEGRLSRQFGRDFPSDPWDAQEW